MIKLDSEIVKIAHYPDPQPYLLITGCTKVFERPFAIGFLPTLYSRAKFGGDILFLDFGCTRHLCDLLCDLGVIVIKPDWQKKESRDKEWSPDTLAAMNVALGHVVKYLELWTKHTHIIIADAGDLWFQGPLDEMWSLVNDAVALYPEPNTIDGDWFQSRLGRLDEESRATIKQFLRPGMHTYNGGVIVGERKRMIAYLRAVFDYVALGPADFFGVDQVWKNFIIHSRREGLHIVDLPWRFNCIPGWVTLLQDGKGDFYNPMSGQYPSILHNAGHRLLPRTVNGEDLNIGNSFAIP